MENPRDDPTGSPESGSDVTVQLDHIVESLQHLGDFDSDAHSSGTEMDMEMMENQEHGQPVTQGEVEKFEIQHIGIFDLIQKSHQS